MDQYLILFFGYYSFVIFLMESGKFDKNMIGSGYLQHGTLLVNSFIVWSQWAQIIAILIFCLDLTSINTDRF